MNLQFHYVTFGQSNPRNLELITLYSSSIQECWQTVMLKLLFEIVLVKQKARREGSTALVTKLCVQYQFF